MLPYLKVWAHCVCKDAPRECVSDLLRFLSSFIYLLLLRAVVCGRQEQERLPACKSP